MTIPADIECYVERHFAPAERPLVLELIRSAVLHDGRPASPRLVRCALWSSRGSLAALRAQVGHMKIDYRDVILEGEYEPRRGEVVRVRNLDEAFKDDG